MCRLNVRYFAYTSVFCVTQENYGKADEACVNKVKELYNVLDLEVLFLKKKILLFRFVE